jgi:hypothetical protein
MPEEGTVLAGPFKQWHGVPLPTRANLNLVLCGHVQPAKCLCASALPLPPSPSLCSRAASDPLAGSGRVFKYKPRVNGMEEHDIECEY